MDERLDCYYHEPKFELEVKRIKSGVYPLVHLADLCSQITDGTHYTPSYVEIGVPFISVKDVREFKISFDDTKYITEEEHQTLSKRCHPQPFDILLTKVGTIGLAAIVPDDAPEFDLFVSVCLLKLKSETDAAFLCGVLNSPVARVQFARALKGIGVPDLHLENIRETLIPFPPLAIQQKLVAELEAARAARQQKLAQADALLAGLDEYLLAQLGLAPPRADERQVFAVRLDDAKVRCDVDYNSPRFRALRRALENGSHPLMTIGEICESLNTGFAAGRESQAFNYESGVPHIRPLNITPHGEMSLEGTKFVPREVVTENEILQHGEVLFNNTNSTNWVGKTTVFNADCDCACSNHITRLTLKQSVAEPHYIAALFNTFRALGLFGLLSTNFNNQAGINTATLSSLKIPIPNLKTQQAIAAEVQRRRGEARRLRDEAEAQWQTAKARFEQQLLGEAE